MAVLLIAEHNNKELRPFTLNAATAASQIDSDVHAVIIGQNSADAAKQLSELPVVKKVLSVEGAHYENFTAENFAPVIVKLAENYSHIVCSANTFGKNLMPRIAAHLDTSQVSDIIKVISPDTFLRPIYAGNAFATIKSNDANCIAVFKSYIPYHVLKIPVVNVAIAKCSTAPKSDNVSIITKAKPAKIAGRISGIDNLKNAPTLLKPKTLPASIIEID